MRILMTHWVYLPEFSGAALQSHRLSRELQQLGVSVQVLTGTHEKGLVGIDEQDGIIVRRVLRDRASLAGQMNYWWSTHRCIQKLGKRIDLVHTHGFHPRVNIAAERMGLPIIVKITNQSVDDPLAVQARRLGGLSFRLYNMAEAVIATSNLLEETCRTAGLAQGKIVRIPNGVDTDVFRPAGIEEKAALRDIFHSADDKIVLLTVGTVDYRKGLDALIKAIYELDEEVRQKIRLWVVGPTQNLSNYGTVQPGFEAFVDQVRRMIKDFGLENIVQFKGRQINVHDYMRAADIYVHPSRMEGQPNAILEAMACGLPVLANLLPGITDEILQSGRYGFLVDVENSGRFAAALRVLINNASLRQRIGEQAQRHVARYYSLRQIAQRYLSLYSSIIHKGTFDELKARSKAHRSFLFSIRSEK